MVELGWVKFTLGGEEHKATLTLEGWSSPDSPGVAELLNEHASPDQYGPADGDPVWCAVEEARSYLDGTETYARPVPEYPEDAVI